MSRIAWFVVVIICVIVAYFAITHYQESYKVLPAKLVEKPQTTPFKDWQEFSLDRFSVLLPAVPQNAKDEVHGHHYDMYVSEKPNGTIFMISLIDFSQAVDPDKTNAILNAIMEDLLSSNPENELISSQMDTFKNVKAVDFVIKNKKVVMKGKTFLEGKTLFVLTYISKLDNNNESEYEFFIHSFHLLNSKKKGISL